MRTIGANSHSLVSLKKLNEIFKEDALILVSRKFLEKNNIQGQSVRMTPNTINGAGNMPIVEETVSIQEII